MILATMKRSEALRLARLGRQGKPYERHEAVVVTGVCHQDRKGYPVRHDTIVPEDETAVVRQVQVLVLDLYDTSPAVFVYILSQKEMNTCYLCRMNFVHTEELHTHLLKRAEAYWRKVNEVANANE